MTDANIETQIEALSRLDLAGLRDAWQRRFGRPSRVRSPDLLRRKLAFELQADIYGGLTSEVRAQIRKARSTPRQKSGLQRGAVIMREWRGTKHEVTVVNDGFEHAGQRYRSLSEVARVITGARWSGPRFFGLVDKAAD